jgi:hypothetical protein
VINTLLGKIAGFFDKDFLFASFLPALLFGAALLATLAAVVGISSTVAVYESGSAWQHAGAAVSLGLILVVFAYVLSALRPSIIRVWSGRDPFPLYLSWPFIQLGQLWHRRSFRRLHAATRPASQWSTVRVEFETAVRGIWQATGPELDSHVRKRLLRIARTSLDDLSPQQAHKHLAPIIEAYREYSGEALVPVYLEAKLAIISRGESELIRAQTAEAELDRRFGTLNTIRATRLGNLIEAYNQYSYKRYKIEAEIFWPRLRKVIPAEYWSILQEPRILLDFALAMASLSLAYSVFAAIIGPWLWYDLRVWIPLCLVSVLSAVFFYRVGIRAAEQFGELVRSSFDLFRLDLLKAMGRPSPATYFDEREDWEDLSRVAVYGNSLDFKLNAPAKPAAADGAAR